MPARLAVEPYVGGLVAIVLAAVVAVALPLLAIAVVLSRPARLPRIPVGVIAGRIVDPQGLRSAGTTLRVWRHREPYAETALVVEPSPDGSFVTPYLPAGPYVLELIRTPADGTARNVIGLAVVSLRDRDVRDVTIAVRRDTALIGRFRMLSDDPDAAWPAHVTVAADLAFEGQDPRVPIYAEGAPGGTFVLRNAFGPRILRVYYFSVTWRPLRVLLDGRDVTNVPVDYSAHEGSDLAFVLTEHPARMTGTVVDHQGRPVPGAWITVTGTDAAAREAWSWTTDATQADRTGAFSIVMIPGDYHVAALPPSAVPYLSEARRRARTASGGLPVRLDERATVRAALVLPGC